MILAEAPYEKDELTLLVDVGTNAEIVLGNRQRLLACSSPTGPAFEGAQISSGQRAAPGAIERLRIDPATLEPRYKVIGSDLWSDEPGFEAAVAATGVTGICGSGIIEAIAEMFLAGIVTADGVIDGALAARTPRLVAEGRTFSYVIREGAPRIAVTQADVRAIQLAKAALYAGARLLMDHYGATQVDAIVLAGAFGSHIDVKYAMVLGLIPDCALDRVRSAGNAAGTGARIALLNASARREIEMVVRRIEKIETALEPRFQEHFVNAMALPHKVDAFPNLAQAVALPARTVDVLRRAPAAAERWIVMLGRVILVAMNRPLSPTTTAAEGMPRRRFTVAELEEMTAAGILLEDERIELIGGEVVPMSPKGNQHEVVKTALTHYWSRRLPERPDLHD